MHARHLTEQLPNPVILLPGLFGSKLVVPGSGRSVWGDFSDGMADPMSAEGAQLFAFPMEPGKSLDKLDPLSEVDGTLSTVDGRIAGIQVRVRAYGEALAAIGVGSWPGARDADGEASGDAAFEFAYDFRRSIDHSACLLELFMRRATRFLQVQRGSHAPIRFDVVAHSQGGLVLRWFLRYGGSLLPYDGLPRPTWAGADLIDRAIVVGSPSAGATLAVDRLVSGVPGNPLHPPYGPVLMGSFPSGYQLLPRHRHDAISADDGHTVDPLDPEFWLARDIGMCSSTHRDARERALTGIEGHAARRDVAEDHLRKCLANAGAFQAALDRPMPDKPAHLGLHLFLSNGKDTGRRVSVAAGEQSVEVVEQALGDGTVTCSSALMSSDGVNADLSRVDSPVPWDSITQLKSGHLALMHDPALLAALPGLLGRNSTPIPMT